MPQALLGTRLVNVVASSLGISHQKLFEVAVQNLGLSVSWKILFEYFTETGLVDNRVYNYLQSLSKEEEHCQTS